jgi:hypothetical protein
MSKRRTVVKVDARSRDGLVVSDPMVVDDGTDESPDIAPALSDHEWAVWRGQRINPVTMLREVSGFAPNPDNLWKTIAITNDQLHEEDPRKFTRLDAEMLRKAAACVAAAQSESKDDEQSADLGELFSELHEFADVITSLLRSDD